MADISKIKLPDGTEYGIKDNSTIASISAGDNSGEVKVTPRTGSAYAVKPKDLNDAAYKAVDQNSWSNDHSHIPTSKNITDLGSANIKTAGYSKPASTSAITTSDTINSALGKLEKGLDVDQTNISSIADRVSDCESDIAELKNIYITPQMFGAVGDGVTDDSQAFINAIASNVNNMYIPQGTYRLKDVSITKNYSIISDGAIIKPIYTNGIANNVFSVSNCDNFKLEGVIFTGDKNGAIDYNVMRKSAVECTNLKSVEIKNVKFDVVDDSITGIETLFKNRKGMFVTCHDVDDVTFDTVVINENKTEEGVWISPVTKQRNNTVTLKNITTTNTKGLSIFDVIAKNLYLSNSVSDESDNSPGSSWCNFLCENIYIENCEFKGSFDVAIDTHEARLNMAEILVIDKCVFDNKEIAIDTMAIRAKITNCISNVRQFIRSWNSLPTEHAEKFDWAYDTLVPNQSTIIANNSIISRFDNYYGCRFEASGGQLIFANNACDAKNHKGTMVRCNAADLICTGNNFDNLNLVAGSSSVKGFLETSSMEEHTITISSNNIDKNIGASYGRTKEITIAGNNGLRETSPYIAVSAFKINTDVDTINVVCAYYNGKKSFLSSLGNTSSVEIGELIPMTNDRVALITANGSLSSKSVNGMQASESFNRGIKVSFPDGSIWKIIAAQTYNKSTAPSPTGKVIGDYLKWDGQDIIKIADGDCQYKLIAFENANA